MQIGLSPKLYPAIALAVLGVIVAALIDKTAGLSIIGTAAVALGGGYVQPVGEVIAQPVGMGSDALLSDEALDKVPPPPA